MQRGGVHRHEHVDVVAWSEDFLIGEVDLKRAHAGEGSGRGADLSRKVGQRADVVPRERRLGRELHAGELHAVARVAGKANDDGVLFLDRFGCVALLRGGTDIGDLLRSNQ